MRVHASLADQDYINPRAIIFFVYGKGGSRRSTTYCTIHTYSPFVGAEHQEPGFIMYLYIHTAKSVVSNMT